MSRIMIVVEFELKPQHTADFIKLMKNHAELSRAEDGCQQFDVLQAQNDPNKIFFVEGWRDAEALAVHAKIPAYGAEPRWSILLGSILAKGTLPATFRQNGPGGPWLRQG